MAFSFGTRIVIDLKFFDLSMTKLYQLRCKDRTEQRTSKISTENLMDFFKDFTRILHDPWDTIWWLGEFFKSYGQIAKNPI